MKFSYPRIPASARSFRKFINFRFDIKFFFGDDPAGTNRWEQFVSFIFTRNCKYRHNSILPECCIYHYRNTSVSTLRFCCVVVLQFHFSISCIINRSVMIVYYECQKIFRSSDFQKMQTADNNNRANYSGLR